MENQFNKPSQANAKSNRQLNQTNAAGGINFGATMGVKKPQTKNFLQMNK